MTLILLLVAFAIFTSLEIVLPREKISVPDRARGMLFYFASVPINALVAAALTALIGWLGLRPLVQIHSSFGYTFIASLVVAGLADFKFYWFHRFQHRFLWRFHAVHHSIENVTAINSYHHWSEPFFYSLVVGIPSAFIDVQALPVMLALSAFFRLQHFFIHSQTRLHLGPMARLIVDNRYHRIHHSTDPKHHNRNFGAMTPLWDWLFGTLHFPRNNEWPATGLAEVKEPQSLAEWSSLPWRLRPNKVSSRHGRSALLARPRAEPPIS
jgi:sterol desaturase/sphingolipid hydroxylase (fatty acid hydroxylase superfamily)